MNHLSESRAVASVRKDEVVMPGTGPEPSAIACSSEVASFHPKVLEEPSVPATRVSGVSIRAASYVAATILARIS